MDESSSSDEVASLEEAIVRAQLHVDFPHLCVWCGICCVQMGSMHRDCMWDSIEVRMPSIMGDSDTETGTSI